MEILTPFLFGLTIHKLRDGPLENLSGVGSVGGGGGGQEKKKISAREK